MKAADIRKFFPELEERVYGKSLVYFDNAATSLKPDVVVKKWVEASTCWNANIHRAVHYMAGRATEEFEATREMVREFVNAKRKEEIVFTSGATFGINLVAFSFGEAFVGEGDEIVVSEAEHHSNLVPWKMLCERKGAVLKVVGVDESGVLKLEDIYRAVTRKTRLVAVSHISNVLGLINPIKEIVAFCHSKNVPVLVDGAQGIVHSGVDVQDVDCDFYVFSGHKIFAAPGTGVLYGKKEWLEQMPPFMGGGEMIRSVSFDGVEYADLPYKFEAGTPNLSGIPTLQEAIVFANTLRDRELCVENEAVKAFLLDKLMSMDRLTLYGVPCRTEDKISLFSFSIEGVHNEDLALILDKKGIAARSGKMCAEPLMKRFGVSGMLRISLMPYNTKDEAEYFLSCLNAAVKMLS